MLNDIRVYNYYDDEPLVTRMAQIKSYLDKKFSESRVEIDFSEIHEHLDKVDDDVKAIHFDVDLSEVTDKLDDMSLQIKSSFNDIVDKTEDCKEEIIEKIEESKPCLCKMATKEDVCHIIKHIENSKKEIIEEIDEKFVNLNDLVK